MSWTEAEAGAVLPSSGSTFVVTNCTAPTTALVQPLVFHGLAMSLNITFRSLAYDIKRTAVVE